MSDIKNVPELRFSDFKGLWEPTKLREVTEYTKGFAFKSEDYQAEGIRIVRVSDLGADRIKVGSNLVCISEDKASAANKYLIMRDNIIITTVGSRPELLESAVGRGIYVRNENEGLLNQNLLKLNNTNKSLNGFLIGYINSPRYINYISSIQRGNANQSNITVKDLFEYKVHVPDIEEQQKIADFLSSVDKKIEQLTEKHRLLSEYKKGVMQQIFSQQIRFKDNNGNDYPEWEVRKLGSISKRKTAKNKDESISQVLTNSATQGIVSQTDYFDKDIANQNNLGGYYIVDTNDFVYNPRISVSAPVGPIKRNHLGQGVMSPLYTVFEITEGSRTFFERYFDTTLWHRYMNQIANFGARHDRMNVTTVDFYNMPMPFPCFEEQQKIASFLTEIDQKIDLAWSQLDQTKAFKKGLLQKMFV